jgi:hypothetical protein
MRKENMYLRRMLCVKKEIEKSTVRLSHSQLNISWTAVCLPLHSDEKYRLYTK